MSQTIIGAANYSTTAVVPSDGDPAVAASVQVSLQRLLNNTVYLNTQLSHQAFDDRGKTSTVTGAIVLNDGGGSVEFNVPVELDGGVSMGSNPVEIVTSAGQFTVFCDAEFKGPFIIGTAADSVNIYTETDIWRNTSFHRDVSISSSGELSTDGPVHMGGDTTFLVTSTSIQLGDNPTTQVLNVGCNAFFREDVDIDEDLEVDGTLTVGGAATFQSNVTAEDNLHVDEDLTVSGDAAVDGSLTVNDDITCRNLTAEGDTILGNNSANDTVTFNALLAGALDMGENGRVRPSTGAIVCYAGESSQVGLGNSRVISLELVTPGTFTLTIDDSGLGEGDSFELFAFFTSAGTIIVNNNQNSSSVSVSTNSIVKAHKFPAGWIIAAIPGTVSA